MLFLLAACTEPPPTDDPMTGVRVGFDYTATLGDGPDFTRFPRWMWAYDKQTEFVFRLEQTFYEWPPPRAVRVIEEGACRITIDVSSCDTPCDDHETCLLDVCVDLPPKVDLGPTVFSFYDQSMVVEGERFSHAHWTTGPDGPLSVLVDGTYLEAGPIFPPDYERDAPLALADRSDGDGEILWNDRLVGARVRLDAIIENNQGDAGELICEGPDTGRLIVPESIRSWLTEGRYWGWAEFQRYVIATSHADPGLAFEVRSRHEEWAF